MTSNAPDKEVTVPNVPEPGEKFYWGAATAAYQVEGSPLADGAGRCIWHWDLPSALFAPGGLVQPCHSLHNQLRAAVSGYRVLKAVCPTGSVVWPCTTRPCGRQAARQRTWPPPREPKRGIISRSSSAHWSTASTPKASKATWLRTSLKTTTTTWTTCAYHPISWASTTTSVMFPAVLGRRPGSDGKRPEQGQSVHRDMFLCPTRCPTFEPIRYQGRYQVHGLRKCCRRGTQGLEGPGAREMD